VWEGQSPSEAAGEPFVANGEIGLGACGVALAIGVGGVAALPGVAGVELKGVAQLGAGAGVVVGK
jgi:hypothetical protein